VTGRWWTFWKCNCWLWLGWNSGTAIYQASRHEWFIAAVSAACAGVIALMLWRRHRLEHS
jgi:hypothetical protein